MRTLYGEDIAHIHDVGFGAFAAQASPGVASLLWQCGVRNGTVVELGCGNGILAESLVQRGYQVVGVDVSLAMIRRARQRVPKAKFVHRSLESFSLPRCAAVVAIGESLNYVRTARQRNGLNPIIRRVFDALRPGGCFLFDVAVPGLAFCEHGTKTFAEGDGWAVLVEKQANRTGTLMTRRIVAYRRIGRLYRRSEEVHQLRLYDSEHILSALSGAGFRTRILRGYGKQALLLHRNAYLAVKPKT